MARDAMRNCIGVDIVAQVDVGSQHLQVFARQYVIVRAVNRVAAHLNGVLRGAHDGCPNALAGRQKGPGEVAARDPTAQRPTQWRAEVVEGSLFLAIDEFSDTTGKN